MGITEPSTDNDNHDDDDGNFDGNFDDHDHIEITRKQIRMPILVLGYLGILDNWVFGYLGLFLGNARIFFNFSTDFFPFKGTLHRENVIFAGGGVLSPAKVSQIFTSTSCKRTMKI